MSNEIEKKIYSIVPAIIDEIQAVGKDHKNEVQKYKFRSIDDVYNAANKALAKHKATITPAYSVLENIIQSTVDQYGKTKYTRQVVLQGNYRVYADDGSYIECCTIGEANDTSDKAFNKAMSAAYKYFMFQTFIIPTEEEKDTEVKSPNLIKPQMTKSHKAWGSCIEFMQKGGDINKITEKYELSTEDLEILKQAKKAE